MASDDEVLNEGWVDLHVDEENEEEEKYVRHWFKLNRKEISLYTEQQKEENVLDSCGKSHELFQEL